MKNNTFMEYTNPFREQLNNILNFFSVDVLIGIFVFALAVFFFALKERVFFVVFPLGFLELLVLVLIIVKLN